VLKKLTFTWLNLNRLVTVIVFVAIFTMAIRYPADHDTWWHLRAGQLMVESGAILTTDPFSHTQNGQLWVDHGWLAQIIWYEVLAVGGWPAVALALAAIVTLAFWLTWLQCEGNLYLKAFALVLAAISASIIWAARPQMVSFLLTALAALILYRFKRNSLDQPGRAAAGQSKSMLWAPGNRVLLWLPLIILLWVNIHGGFAIAFILMICYAVGEAFNRFTARENNLNWQPWRHLLLTIFISLAVVWINPNTWQMWLYPFRTVGIGVLRDFIAEWQSPNFHQPIVQPFLLMLLLMLAAFARSGRKVDWTDLALVGAWTTLSLFAARNVPVFALVCTPIFVRYANAALKEQFGPISLGRARRLSKPVYLLNWLLLGLVLLGAAAQTIATLSPQAIRKAEAERFPAEAVRFIEETAPPGPLFNSYNFGGYLIFKLWPAYPVFVDGRTDLYDDAFLRNYLATVAALPDWQTQLDDSNIQLIVIEQNSPLALVLTQHPGWNKLFEDDQAIIFKRQQTEKK